MTKLQSTLKWINDISKSEADYETWKKSVFEYGIECYIKAMQGKLIDVDYKGGYRNVKEKSK